jgi:hypothetical protein
MTMFDVRYLYLFLNVYLIYIKGIIAYTRKKKILYQKNPSKYFYIYLSFKKIFIPKKLRYLTLT